MKKLIAMLLALVMVFALVACGGGSSSTPAGDSSTPAASTGDASTPAGDSGEAKDLITKEAGCTIDTTGVDLSGKVIGYVTITSTAPWGGRVGTELKRMAEEAGAKVQVLDANTEAPKVPEYCQQMIDAGVDALCVFGGDPEAMVDVAKACADAGIPLFLCGLDVAEAGREFAVACIGPDQEKAIYDIGQRVIADNGADSAQVVAIISGVPFLADYQQRDAGFAAAMADTNYEVLETQYAFSSRTDAKGFTENWLQSRGDDLSILMGMDDDLTMGAVQAIDEAGKTGSIKVYSFTGQNDAIQAVADGKMVLTVMNRADDIAAETCVAMYQYFTTGSTEYYHYTPLTTIDSSNVNDYIGKGEF